MAHCHFQVSLTENGDVEGKGRGGSGRQELIKIAQHFDLHKLGKKSERQGSGKRESFPSTSGCISHAPRSPAKSLSFACDVGIMRLKYRSQLV